MSKLISIIIPVHNEKENIPLIYQAIIAQFQKLGENFDYEIIFVDDGSTDSGSTLLEGMSQTDEKMKYIQFSRNFGKEIATTAGINHANGDAAIIIDADLQHPPELIPEFIAKWQQGADTVIGVRKKNKGENLLKKMASTAFYDIINFIGEIKIVPKSTDYRLINRKIIDEFNRFTEHSRITRGLLDWLGFKKDYIYFETQKRLNGKASYSRRKLFKLAMSAFITHSLFPLKLAGYLGIVIILFSGPLGAFIFVDKYILGDHTGWNFSGPAILGVLILFLVGIILINLGLIALYIANIQGEVLNRPIYVTRKKKNFNRKLD